MFGRRMGLHELFMFSDTDALVQAAPLEQLVNQKQRDLQQSASSKGSVVRVKFCGTAHVQHYVAQPKKYTSAVSQLLAKATAPPA